MDTNFIHEDEIDFKAVMRTPKRQIGLFLILLIAAIEVAGWFYLNNMSVAYLKTTIDLPEPINTFERAVDTKAGTFVEGIDLKKYYQPNDSMINKGKELFLATCASCHNQNGDGNGQVGVALNPKPRNFISAEGWKFGRNFADIFKTLKQGSPGTAMASFDAIPLPDRMALIYFIQTFAKDFPKPTVDDFTALDGTYNLSKGGMSPNNVTLETAEQKIIDENKVNNEKLAALIKTSEDNCCAPPLKKVIRCKEKAYGALLNSNAWVGSTDNFVKFLQNTISTNGFKPTILTLSSQELTTYYNYFLTLKKS
ncbi:MAG: cytochrome c [Candidatus Kapabacteria bacterium]|nr:cytochrome c [Candidatus Kapabacteria bacterium]